MYSLQVEKAMTRGIRGEMANVYKFLEKRIFRRYKREKMNMTLKKFMKKILMMDGVILVTTIVITRIGGWWSVRHYINILFLAGIAVVGGGALVSVGGWNTTRNFEYQYASSVRSESLLERQEIDTKDRKRTYSSTVLLIVSGVVLVLCAVLTDKLVG